MGGAGQPLGTFQGEGDALRVRHGLGTGKAGVTGDQAKPTEGENRGKELGFCPTGQEWF